MIKIQTIFGEDVPVIPTYFPDGTQQVWKLNLSNPNSSRFVRWDYENERELITIMQLSVLLKNMAPDKSLELVVPYLPYARQDKPVHDEASFAKVILADAFRNFDKVYSVDVHSESYPSNVYSVAPNAQIRKAIKHLGSKEVVIVYPDHGASVRYKHMFLAWPYIVMDKTREQSTGKITGMKIAEKSGDVDSRHEYLIVDDISDGGRTFKEVAKVLKADRYDIHLSLYVSHFLGHGGIEGFKEAGIQKIFTTDSLEKYRERSEHDLSSLIIV